MTFYLTITGPKVSLRVIPPTKGTLRVGSHYGCDLTIVDHGLAPVHLEFILSPRFSVHVHGPQASIIDTRTQQELRLTKGRTRELSTEDLLFVGKLKISWQGTPSSSANLYVLDWKDIELNALDIPDKDGTFLARIKGDYEILKRLHAQLSSVELIAGISEHEYAVVFVDRSLAEIQRLLHTVVRPEAFGIAPWQAAMPRAALAAATPSYQPQRSHNATFVSKDPAMQETMHLLAQAASSLEPVLIVGETGTGKDCLINELHYRSGRAERPLIRLSAIDVSDQGIADTTVASANGGTLAIDEISALSSTAQFSLARDLERGYLSGVRLVATSSEPLKQIVEHQCVNKRLFYRLARFLIHIPPLRQRQTDIVHLANTFLSRHETPPLDPPIEDLFLRYTWPGNVRELESIVARAVLSSGQNPLGFVHLPVELRNFSSPPHSSPHDPPVSPHAPTSEPLSLREEIAALERRRIMEALDTYPTQTEAAKALGIPLRTFVNRMDTLGIPRARKNKS